MNNENYQVQWEIDDIRTEEEARKLAETIVRHTGYVQGAPFFRYPATLLLEAAILHVSFGAGFAEKRNLGEVFRFICRNNKTGNINGSLKEITILEPAYKPAREFMDTPEAVQKSVYGGLTVYLWPSFGARAAAGE